MQDEVELLHIHRKAQAGGRLYVENAWAAQLLWQPHRDARQLAGLGRAADLLRFAQHLHLHAIGEQLLELLRRTQPRRKRLCVHRHHRHLLHAEQAQEIHRQRPHLREGQRQGQHQYHPYCRPGRAETSRKQFVKHSRLLLSLYICIQIQPPGVQGTARRRRLFNDWRGQGLEPRTDQRRTLAQRLSLFLAGRAARQVSVSSLALSFEQLMIQPGPQLAFLQMCIPGDFHYSFLQRSSNARSARASSVPTEPAATPSAAAISL